jgi:hypothetical protein
LDEIALQPFQGPFLLLEVVTERVTVPVEQVGVAPRHLGSVGRVNPHRIVADTAAQPQPSHRGPRTAHIDRQLSAQVDAALGFLVPGIATRRRRAVPLFEYHPHVDVLLQAADPQLFAVRADERAHGRQGTTRRVRVDGRVVDPEHPAVRTDRHDQLQQPAAHASPLRSQI